MLIVVPHPDDETLGVGGLIASQRRRGVDVVVVAVTDGENAYTDNAGLAERRHAEQTQALACLGVADHKIVRLRLPDSNVSSQEQALVELLVPLVSDETHIVAPWQGDFHPDHAACGSAAARVAQRSGSPLTSYFFWTWHLATPSLLSGLSLRRVPLSPELLHAKAEALVQHRSQLMHPSGEPILPERLLAPARRSFEVFLPS